MIYSIKEEQTIRRLPSSRMLKSEVADYADKIISIVQDHDPESVLINPVFDLLKAKKPEIEMLRLNYGVDTERLKTNKLKGEMMLAVSAFKLDVRMLKRSSLELDLHVIQNAINTHLRYLNRCRNDKELNQKITGFLELVDNDAILSETLDEFNLINSVNKVRIAHDYFVFALEKRVKLLSQRPKVLTNVIIKGIVEAIDNLFKGIELAQLIGIDSDVESESQVDYTPLIDELDQLSNMFYRSISIRDANSKRKAEMDDTENSDEDDSTDKPETSTEEDTSTEVETTAMNGNGEHHPLQVYAASTIKKMDKPSGQTSTIDSGNGSLESEDQEKAVVLSWGTSQQPLSTDKA